MKSQRAINGFRFWAMLLCCALPGIAFSGTVTVGCASAMDVTQGTMSEAAWSTVGWTSIASLDLGSNPDNVTGEYKTLWDANYVYMGFRISDPNIDNSQTGCLNYDDSAVVFYFDLNN